MISIFLKGLKYSIFILVYFFYYAFLSVKYIILNKYLRFPFILLLLNIFYSAKLTYLYILYFLYLLHVSAIKFNIYLKLKIAAKNTFNYILRVTKSHSLSKNILYKTFIYNNIILDLDDTIFTIPYLIVTSNGIYNIHILDFENFNDSIFDYIYLFEETLNNNFEKDIPLTNIVLYKDHQLDSMNLNNKDYTYVNEKNIIKFINLNNRNLNLDINKVKDLIKENKAWAPDIIFFKVHKFISTNIHLLLFIILCPIIYYYYIKFLSSLFSYFSLLLSYIFNSIF